jgi:isopenicillin N synthase-like dioxygenase
MLRFAKNLLQLEQTLQRMTLEGLGVREETIRSHLGSLTHTLHPSHYGVQQDTDTGSRRLSMAVHRDINVSTLVVQHEVDGLEVQAKDGSWLPIRAEPDTFTFQSGELFTV